MDGLSNEMSMNRLGTPPAICDNSRAEQLTRIAHHMGQATARVPLLRRSSVGAGTLACTACEQAVTHGCEKCGPTFPRDGGRLADS